MLRTFLHHRLTLKRLDRGARGSVVPIATYEDVPAFVQGAQQPTLTPDGRSVIASASAFVDVDAPIDITFDDWRVEWRGRDWEVVGVTEQTDGVSGARHHYRLMLR